MLRSPFRVHSMCKSGLRIASSMKYTHLQYEYRGKWIHVSWCEKFFASDEEHFDHVRNMIFGSEQQVYPEAAARLQERERVHLRRVMALYAGMGLLDGCMK